MISRAINYTGHVVYDDGRVYKSGELLGQYKTMAAAKAAATRNQRRINAERNAAHYAALSRIAGRG